MLNDYRVVPSGDKFMLIDGAGQDVNTYFTRDAARRDIRRCKHQDVMWERARQLIDDAIQKHMVMFEIDRETARNWIRYAAEITE
jgi:hypothetical protein